MKRSPVRIIELCIYILLIVAAIIYVAVTGKKPNPFDTKPIETTVITQITTVDYFYD